METPRRTHLRRSLGLLLPSLTFILTSCHPDPVGLADADPELAAAEAKGGGKGGPSADPLLLWTIDDALVGLRSDGDPTYAHTHPDVLADVNGGRARLYTNQGRRKGKQQDPERRIQIDIAGAYSYSDLVHASAQTKDVLDVASLVVGVPTRVPFRVRWLDDGGQLLTLRFGRECGPDVVVPGERAEIVRHDATSFTVRSLPGVPARLCIDEAEVLGVFAPFSWDFVIDQP